MEVGMKTAKQVNERAEAAMDRLIAIMEAVGEAGEATQEQQVEIAALSSGLTIFAWVLDAEDEWASAIKQIRLAAAAIQLQDKFTAPSQEK